MMPIDVRDLHKKCILKLILIDSNLRDATKFVDYVWRTWVSPAATFEVDIWIRVGHEDIPRTNNHLEGFHSGN